MIIFSLYAAGHGQAPAGTVHPGENIDPAPGPTGEKPYELDDRKLEFPSLITFEDVTGWEVEGANAEGWLFRSQEQRIHGEYSGKLVYLGKDEKSYLTVRPKKPVAIPEPWDLVLFWNYGNNWSWTPDPKKPFVNVTVLLRDADGKSLPLWTGTMDYQYWFMASGRLHREHLTGFKRPFSFVGFQFTNLSNTEKRTIYLGPCGFVKEQLDPLSFDPWPEKLPFPTRPETILPINKDKSFKNSVRQDGTTTVFTYQGADCQLEYRYTPMDGTLGDITVQVSAPMSAFDPAGQNTERRTRMIRPCAGGGMQLIGPEGKVAATSPAAQRTLKEQKNTDNRLTATWRLESGALATDVTYTLSILQKSLIVDIAAEYPIVERVSLGRAEPVNKPKLFKVPYLTFGWGNTDPRVLYTEGVFLFSQFDWYRSDASKLWGAAETGPDWAAYNGSAEYMPKTDGQRNPVRERLFINVSPDLQEVLPGIPNPASPFKDVQRERVWRVSAGADHKAELADATNLRNYGCEKVTIRYHEDSWRDAGESFTFRLNAAPKRGGDEALKKFVASIQALGWRVGLYTNYIDFAPVNSHWSPDHVIRQSNGDWQRSWTRCYSAKPMWAVQMEALLAPRIHAKFGTNHSYCDVHSVFMPCEREDFDARVAGAATFRRTYECYGRLLYNEKMAHDGPVYSEGRNHWIYAGLTDGNYAQLASDAPSKEPLLVDFDLLKIHPLEMDAGMGDPSMFFKTEPWDLDQYLATTIAYGHIGYLGWNSLEGILKIYYMMQSIQPNYAMVPVQTIEYEKDGRFLETSKALAEDIHLNSHVHVVYENGTHVYVNGSDQGWLVDLPWFKLPLPKWGYLVVNRSGQASMSAMVPIGGVDDLNGPLQRVDLTTGTDQFYLNSRGGFVFVPQAAVQGSAVLKKENGKWYVIPTPSFTDAAFSPRLIGASPAGDAEIVPIDGPAEPADKPEVRWSRGLLHIIPGPKPAARYEIRPGTGQQPPVLGNNSTLARLKSKRMYAAVPLDVKVNPAQVTWERGGQTLPANPTIANQVIQFSIPEDFKPGEHVWLKIQYDGGIYWLDFIVAAEEN